MVSVGSVVCIGSWIMLVGVFVRLLLVNGFGF